MNDDEKAELIRLVKAEIAKGTCMRDTAKKINFMYDYQKHTIRDYYKALKK